MVNHRLILDLVERTGEAPRGSTVTVELGEDTAAAQTVAAWCERAGHALVQVRGTTAVVRCGPAVDVLAGIEPEQVPGTRVWLYTNFDCNLACDYCCARSSPRTPRRALGLDRVRRLAAEAADAGVSELLLTGGEPFLLPDIDQLANACTRHLPTTLLTNGMLFRGSRLDRLRAMDRTRLAVQISLDSATPEPHDRHRGVGTWAKAVEGIRIAGSEGFRVRVAATVPAEHTHQVDGFHAFLDTLGIARADQIIRALAHRGVAENGVELTIESLIPEITVTAEGVYWHPVGADHADQLVTRELFPLVRAITEVRRRFIEYRTSASATAQWFPCA
ncbi:Rv1681 family radical SAM protein [Actinokineospora sp.]|uniref:Rv1681 family radical SAM protein n=1 Tax=Actinokineospora sp. TaxID=1872133 RepID=UPI003D6A1D0F